ncbi:MAG: choice-of-anchor B family protein, partial [Verrucomicrobiaceae bacterium]|nr:choice-of-anchor B family protein [Verrucomicrobiaceae bacterium]
MRGLFKIALICFSCAVISPAAATDFDIVINYAPGSNFTPSQKDAFAQAEATWESLITSYKPNSVTAGTTLVINADNPPIDGVNGVLGSAGPTSGILAGSYLFATAGSMSFDSADVAALESNGTWAAVILHEMGHVIGIGTLWSSAGVGVPGFQELYVDGTGQYTGATGLAAFQEEFVGQQSAAFVPVELGGGGGTANGHWNEGDGGGTTGIIRVSDSKDMNLMLMSGWLNLGSFISDTTLGSFEDMGYNTTLVLGGTPDTTPPTANLSSPADGDSIAPTVLNAQGYIEVTFTDSGDGVDAASIDGNELSLSGSGVGTATLSGGAPTLVSGTSYRYGFSGNFVDGTVNVDFVAGSFADLAATPNVNVLETESFGLAPIGEISGTVWDDANGDGIVDTGETLLENWTVFLDDNQNGQLDGGEQSQLTNASGDYAFSSLAAGSYTVAIVTQEGYTQTSPIEALVDPTATADPLGFNVDKRSQVNLAAFNAVAAVSSSKVNDIVAYVSPGGQEYAIIGLERAVGFVRVTDPDNPVIVAVLAGPDEGGTLSLVAANSSGEEHNDEEHPAKEGSTWRDLAVYDEYAYVVNETSGGIQVFDLSLIDSGTVSILSTPGQHGPAKSHNVTINPDSGYLYLSGSSANGLQIYDLNGDPANPSFAGSSPVSYIHDLIVHSYTSGPYAGKEIVFAFSEDSGVRIIDVTDKNNMVVLSTTSYPNKTYTHHGALSEDLQYLFVNDELDEMQNANVSTTTTYVLDVQNLSAPSYVTSFTNGLAAIDHNPMVVGNYIYEANYTSGLRIYDISDINNVTEVGHYDTYPDTNATTFHGAWGVDASLPSGTVIVSDIQSGLIVLDPFRIQANNGSYLVELGDLETVTGVNFGVAGPSPGNVQIIDDGDAGFATAGSWLDFGSPGYQGDLKYKTSGTGSGKASWTFTGLAAGDYEVSVHWWGTASRVPDASYTILDDAIQLTTATVNQKLTPVADHVDSGLNFQVISASVTINSGTLVVELSDNSSSANEYVIADAVRIELVTPAGPDATAPTADLSSPANGDSIAPTVLNAQGYIEVTFTDSGDGV